MVNKIFADDWIRTAHLWCRKQPLYQLSHNHCPFSIYFTKVSDNGKLLSKNLNSAAMLFEQFSFYCVHVEVIYLVKPSSNLLFLSTYFFLQLNSKSLSLLFLSHCMYLVQLICIIFPRYFWFCLSFSLPFVFLSFCYLVSFCMCIFYNFICLCLVSFCIYFLYLFVSIPWIFLYLFLVSISCIFLFVYLAYLHLYLFVSISCFPFIFFYSVIVYPNVSLKRFRILWELPESRAPEIKINQIRHFYLSWLLPKKGIFFIFWKSFWGSKWPKWRSQNDVLKCLTLRSKVKAKNVKYFMLHFWKNMVQSRPLFVYFRSFLFQHQ